MSSTLLLHNCQKWRWHMSDEGPVLLGALLEKIMAPLERQREAQENAQRLAQLAFTKLESEGFECKPGHPSRLGRTEVAVNPIRGMDIAAGARDFALSVDFADEGWGIFPFVYEYISRKDGSLLVVYPMLATPEDADLATDEDVEMEWIGDAVVAVIGPDDWMPVTTYGDSITVMALGGNAEA